MHVAVTSDIGPLRSLLVHTTGPELRAVTRRILQERQQWASGCNAVALRLGVIASYSRSEATLKSLESTGFRIVPAMSFLRGETKVTERDRAVLTFDGSELMRGGGGPRCMTMPLLHDGL
jgi:arginine deiminase